MCSGLLIISQNLKKKKSHHSKKKYWAVFRNYRKIVLNVKHYLEKVLIKDLIQYLIVLENPYRTLKNVILIVLKQLHERLALIDRAQKNIETLSTEVSGLQNLLSNKQSRGAFGEKQMQDLIENYLT